MTDSKVIKPGKDITSNMAEEFRTQLCEIIEKGAKELIIDLEGIKMVDSLGLGVLIATHNSMAESGGKLTIINVPEDIFKLFKIMRLNQHFEVSPAETG